jgi:hypothetical protein
MAYFSEVDSNNIVLQTIAVADSDTQLNGVETESVGVAFCKSLLGQDKNWVQTSYRTRGGKHYNQEGVEDSGVALRYNYAGIGYTYDSTRDAFIAPKLYPSWLLDEDTCQWSPPTPYPDDGKEYIWDEASTSWKEI